MKRKKILILTIFATVLTIFLISKYTGLPFYETSGRKKEDIRNAEVDDHEGHKEESSERIVLSEEAFRSATINTVIVKKTEVGKEIRTTATIEPDETRISHVAPRIPGRVINVKVLLGDKVKEGQILAELDSLQVGKAKADFLKAKADLQVARANYDREKRLYEQKISSEKEYLDAKGEFLKSEAQLKSSREALRVLGLTNSQISEITWGGGEHPLSHFPLIAPFSGTVIEKHIVLGELVKPDNKPYTIADLSRVWIQIDIYEKDLRWVNNGTDVNITVNAYPEKEFGGKVTYISDILDESTRTAKARVEISNNEKFLKTGMFATALITVSESGEEPSIVIPDSALYSVRGKDVVFVKVDKREYEVRVVSLGRDSGSSAEILGGITEGEEIVTDGGFHLKSAYLKEELGGGHGH